MCTIVLNGHNIILRLLKTTFFCSISKEASADAKYGFVDLESCGTNFDRQVRMARVIEQSSGVISRCV